MSAVQSSLRRAGRARALAQLRTLALVPAAMLLSGCASAAGDPKNPPPPSAASTGVAVYALSRGKGVPDETRSAFEQCRVVLEEARERGRAVRVEEQRIGLEGERRLCADFPDPASAEAMAERLRQIAKGVDLMNVAQEPCRKAPKPQ
jgi:hypothetical protein